MQEKLKFVSGYVEYVLASRRVTSEAPWRKKKKRPRKGGWKHILGPVVVLSAGGGGGGGGGRGKGACRRREFERRGGGGQGASCLSTISSSVAGSAGGCGPVVGLPSYKKRQGSLHQYFLITITSTKISTDIES